MTTLELLQFNIRQLWNNCHLSESELKFTRGQLNSLLAEIESRLK